MNEATVVYLPVSVEDELPPLDAPVICGSHNDYRGEFTFRSDSNRKEFIYDYGITFWLKPIKLSELLKDIDVASNSNSNEAVVASHSCTPE
jgi:hypothetical protein